MELREKLRLALAAAPDLRRASTLPRPPDGRANTAALPVKRQQTPSGDVYVAEERWASGRYHGHLALGEALDVSAEALARLAPGLDPADLERTAFIDIETTGLTGGTGTLAFLVGVATFEQGSACLRQYFLANVGGEEAMLAAIADLVSRCSNIVSFNGRCFDIPFLEARFVLSRLRSPFEGLAHMDLLLATRRLHRRRLDSCRLGAIEEAVLGVRRGRDIAGWAIPRLYYDYLRFGAAAPLADVFHHNKLDVLSLITLLAHTGRLLADHTPDDRGHCLALARWDEAQGRLARAAGLYRSVLERPSGGDEREVALHRLLPIQRRLGNWDDMEHLLARSLEDNRDAGSRIRLLVELAKIKEHRRRDFASAVALTREAIALREVLAHRQGTAHLRRAGDDNLDLRLARLLRRIRLNDGKRPGTNPRPQRFPPILTLSTSPAPQRC